MLVWNAVEGQNKSATANKLQQVMREILESIVVETPIAKTMSAVVVDDVHLPYFPLPRRFLLLEDPTSIEFKILMSSIDSIVIYCCLQYLVCVFCLK